MAEAISHRSKVESRRLQMSCKILYGEFLGCTIDIPSSWHHAAPASVGQEKAVEDIRLIAIDWGTSNFRAFRLNGSGEILERRLFPIGVLRVQEGRFAETLLVHVGDWLTAGEKHILLCGMVGSR